ncbi:MAG: PilT/PilU family type 4a pilus ATPase [Candidatus Omnitrophica bacterium]|nr:PilT/PilU family type 4a pilus ATPase [Candidatus Omnitrophota bacterium]
MEAKVFLSACLGKVLELKGQDLFLKVGTVPRTHLAGVIKHLPFEPVKEEMTRAIVEEFLHPKQRENLERSLSVDFAFTLIRESQRFRANVFVQQGTYSLVIRTLWKTIPPPEALRIPPILQKIALERSGLILVGGTVASGKSTTLTSMIDMMNRTVERHIITVEDPIEYIHRDDRCLINQREIGVDAQDFTSALRFAVRQAPDCIFIGEMRDLETFDFALGAAEVGRLVMSTVHAKSVVQILDRVLGFFPPDQRDQILMQLSFNITCFVCQKLLTAKDGSFVPAFEIMVGNYTTRQLVREKKFDKIPQALVNFANEGMLTFDQSIFKLWQEGVIAQEEALRAAERPQEMQNLMKGISLDGSKGRILGS